MSAVFDALPGFEVPVDAISKNMDQMWAVAADEGKPSPAGNDAKATQINLVLHLGFGTTPEDGAAQFQTAVNFSQRYPCRVVVLCPLPLDDTTTSRMRAKIYGECHLGKTKNDTRCCEFVMLSYPMSARRYLESQVSVCLSTDLPLYYWVHRFASATRLADYQYLLLRSKRVILDSAIIPDGFKNYTWPRPGAMRDLALARLLPARQGIGQFLSGCSPATLVENLASIRVSHNAQRVAEGGALLAWARERLLACGMPEHTSTGLLVSPAQAGAPDLSLDFGYTGGAVRFHWECTLDATGVGVVRIDADLCRGPVRMSAPIALLSPEMALGEAMFF